MKKWLFVGIIALALSIPCFAEEDFPDASQNTEVVYRMFRTANIFTFLKLETTTGRIWQVQWGDSSHRFQSPLNAKAFAFDSKVGRFTLYPTRNMFTFILLDQDSGDSWQIQWGKAGERSVVPIE
jgi:hypothetical protein